MESENPRETWSMSVYPIVITMDRYGGMYSGGLWTAFKSRHVPDGARGDDTTACYFWLNPDVPFGVGQTPNEAVRDLIQRVEKSKTPTG